MEQSSSNAAAADGSALARGEQNSTASKKEIYTHDADWTIYAMGWSQREEPDRGFRLARGRAGDSTRRRGLRRGSSAAGYEGSLGGRSTL